MEGLSWVIYDTYRVQIDLISIWADDGPAKTILWLQRENVGGEEACQVLDDIDNKY